MKKILLVHGWNYKFYNSMNISNPWVYRSEFLKLLNDNYQVDMVRLPGFCGTPEPHVDHWSTKDFGLWLKDYIQKTTKNYDYLVGYSFGAPVIIYASLELDLPIPCILISPALRRGDSMKSRFAHFFSWIPLSMKKILRDSYLYFMSPYYKFGTLFLRNSYKIVAREDSVDSVLSLSEKVSIVCIYGTNDSATPLKLTQKDLSKNVAIYSILSGGHNIAKSHPKEIVHILKKITDEI
jgi:pimeloyl-ACP methyl ester carboxylesterase